MLLSIMALIGMAGVAYMGAVQGVYRAAMTLAALVVAGLLGFGLMGPLAGAQASNDSQGVWYYAADAFWLWAVFCGVFLALRSLGERLLKNQPDLPAPINRSGGAVLGAMTGYLAAGLCMILVQMLPTSPELLGYEAFTYTGAKGGESDKVARTDHPLWLQWDRGTLAFFNYLSRWPLAAIGSDNASLADRYGDVFPPDRPDVRGADYKGVLDTDDFLYYHWYRRYEYIRWRTSRFTGPLPEHPRGLVEGPGAPLTPGDGSAWGGMKIQIVRVEVRDTLEEYQGVRPGSNERFILVTARFRPENLPHVSDTEQFVLLGARNLKAIRPRLLTVGRAGKPDNTLEAELPQAGTSPAAVLAPRGKPQFNIRPGTSTGPVLLDGATFKFTATDQVETRTFVFNVSKDYRPEDLRLNVETALPAKAEDAVKGKPEPAKPAETKPPTP
jgi:hypothetical protein